MKKTYLVTERAGDWIAGQRKPKDGKIALSDSQAAYELALGTIALPPSAERPEQERKQPRRKAEK
ncbi:hypothetical protein [Brucella sp. JSBI001]|uniref:hypothetical protein n=1 Tax=Brucella sp. JSBI001 TaxID=2886044 RepID=UPI00124E55D3|nr:hypothetical protein [Brucella sp. JSBI001]KAB2669038.1 hypothetical protein F9K77_15660 [Ochrobactrum sp. LMG 5442]MBM7330776.1 hypothetical protein [Agrobacterium sp. S2]UZD69135.1 hypothetical protein LJ361_18765 [Brucella sp. JSBI001]